MNKQPLLDEGQKSGDGIKEKVKVKFEDVENKMAMLKGYEGFWIKLRRNNCYYVLNKIVSMTLAITCAIITIVFKPTTQAFQV